MESFERKETKYLVTPSQYDMFMALAQNRLAPAEYAEGDIASLYYDTPDYTLINRSLNGPKYKEKLRVRSYGQATDESAVYVEIKKKFKGIVYKRRVCCTLAAARAFLAGMDYEQAIERWPLASAEEREEACSRKSLQVAGEISWLRDHYAGIAPKMTVSTHRTSFVGTDDPELRITFDADVTWKSKDDGCRADRAMFQNGERILEVKCADAYPLWLVEVLDACGIRPQSVSKYGRAYQAACAAGIIRPVRPVFANVPAATTMPVPARPVAPRIPGSAPAHAPARRGVAAAVAAPRKHRLQLPHIFPRRAVA